jgi:uncharacterized membrane protein YedE/YeeE
MLVVLNVLAGVGGLALALEMIDPCSLSYWACVVVLYPAIVAAACVFGRLPVPVLMFIASCVQAGIIIGLYYLIKRWVRRITAPRRRMGIR